jgi:hypothetical protein
MSTELHPTPRGYHWRIHFLTHVHRPIDNALEPVHELMLPIKCVSWDAAYQHVCRIDQRLEPRAVLHKGDA